MSLAFGDMGGTARTSQVRKSGPGAPKLELRLRMGPGPPARQTESQGSDMKSMTVEEARQYCTQPSAGLSVDEHDFLYYDVPEEHGFFINHPLEHRKIVSLTYDLLTASPINCFDGGIIWVYGWHLGTTWMIQPGWRILEDMRRAHGDSRSLDIAPAQYFREDEFVELHAFLVQVMAYGWPACYLPRGSRFFVQLRSSERTFFYARESAMLDELYSKLMRWEPTREDSCAAHDLAIAHFKAAEKQRDEGDLNGAIALYRSSLIADSEYYESAHGLIGALQEAGDLNEAISIARRLTEFAPEDKIAQSTLLQLNERKALKGG